MSVKQNIIDLPQEEIMDNVFDKEENEQQSSQATQQSPADLDAEKLAKLRAKLEKKDKEVTKKKVEPVRSINFGVIGSGQAGSKLAHQMYKMGYDAVVINTAQQDLKFIELPESNKLLLEYSIGGAAKSLEIGKDAALHNLDKIREMIANQLADSQMFVFCTSLGGGSGAGSSEVIIELLQSFGKPILGIVVLPMDSDDVQSKQNALVTLNKMLKDVQTKKLTNLIVVDNAKIEAIYHNVNQMNFFETANKAIVEPLDVFNRMSSMPSPVKALDSMEFVKLLTDGEGLTVYGEFKVENYEEEMSIAEAVISNLNNNLLASGFDIKESRYVGVIIAAPKQVWEKIPASSVNYAMSMVMDQTGLPLGCFKGLYEVESDEDCVKVYSWFTGLGAPSSRTNQLIEETKGHMSAVKVKDTNRNMTLNIDLGKEQTVSEVQKIKDKIATKSSAFGKFLQNNVVDRRKK